jgi:hypothetical protein
MATRIQEFDYSINLLRALLWQDNNTPALTALLQAKQAWYDTNVSTFWSDWVTDVFDIRTANEFGLAVWAIILGVPTTVILPPTTKKNFGFGLPLLLKDASDRQGTWTPTSGTTVTSGQTDPNAGSEAVLVNMASSGGTAKVAMNPATSGIPAGTCTLTFQAKLLSGTQGTISSDINGTAVAWPTLTAGVWTPITLTFTNPAAASAFNIVNATGSTAQIDIFYPKLCAGASTSNGNLNFNNGNFGSLTSQPANLTTDQKRILLLLRYFKLTTLPSVTAINEGLKRILGSYGGVYVLDGLNMTYVTYVFGFQPDSALSFILNNYDVMPRPAAVGVRYVISTRATFGFGPYNKNFNNGTFGA